VVGSIIGASLCFALVIFSLLAGPKAMTPIASAVSVLRRHVLPILACLVVCPTQANAQKSLDHVVNVVFQEGYVTVPYDIRYLHFQNGSRKSDRLVVESVTYYDGRKSSAEAVAGSLALPPAFQSLVARYAGRSMFRVFRREAFDERARLGKTLRGSAYPAFGRHYHVRFASREAAQAFTEEVQRLSGVEEADLFTTDYSLDGDVTDVPPNDPNYSQQ
jgi:hypothetical protein